MFGKLVKRKLSIILLLACIFFGLSSLSAAENRAVSVNLYGSTQHIKASEPFTLAIEFKIDQGTHIYWKNPGDTGRAPQFNWKIPEGVKIVSLEWPAPIHFTLSEMVGFGYEENSYFLATLVSDTSYQNIEDLKLGLDVNWIGCSSTHCMPGSATVGLMTKTRENFNALMTLAESKMPKKAEVQFSHDYSNLVVQSEKNVNQAHFYSDQEGETAGFKSFTFSKNSQGKIHFAVDPSLPKNAKGILVLKDREGNFLESIDLSYSTTASFFSILFSKKFILSLFLAFLGGLLLNGMPCVLPVLSIKALSLVKMAGENRSHVLRHTFAFTAGVIVSFWVLASALFALTALGRSVGWGFQLQEPIFVAFLAILLFLLALNLFGVFEMGTSIASWAGTKGGKVKKEGLTGAFFSGVLATAVATPCTGPFLGTTLGFALTLPLVLSYSIFTFLALGLSFPYLILGFFPELLRFFPKPGAWMETFKQAMGFILMATVLWLLWVFAAQTASDALIILLGACLILSMGVWVLGRYVTLMSSKKTRLLSYLFLVSTVVISCYLVLDAVSYSETPHAQESGQLAYEGSKKPLETKGGIWEPFSKERLDELEKAGVPVFIDFTAKWCLICQTNHRVLMQERVLNAFKEKNVVLMQADFTKKDPAIGNELKKQGRAGVPLYLILPGQSNQKPLILPQLLTTDNIIEAVHTL
jgi:thiol:disulfide interchange protein